jgi:hypothetical protein
MAAAPLSGTAETGEDVIFTLERGYRTAFLRRGVTMLIVAALCGFVAVSSGFIAFGATVAAAFLGIGGLHFLGKYFWSMRFRTRLTPEGIEARGYVNHFVRWSDIADIESRGYELPPGRRPLNPPYVTSSGRIDRGYASVGAGRSGYARARRPGSMGGIRAKLYTVRISRSHGRRLVLPAPVVTAWQSDPKFDDKLRLIHQWWQTYGQAAVAGQSGTGNSYR